MSCFCFSESHKRNARSRMPSRSLIHIQAFSERLRKSSRQQRLWQSRLTMFGQVNHGRASTGWSREEQLHQATGSHHGGHPNAVHGDSSRRNHERYVEDQVNMEDIVECYYLQEDDRMGTRCIVFFSVEEVSCQWHFDRKRNSHGRGRKRDSAMSHSQGKY